VLSVLSVAYSLARVSADAVGGAEQVLAALDRALVSAGHRSLVLACRGSRVAGQLVPIEIGTGSYTSELRAGVTERYREQLGNLVTREHIDVVHFHGVDCGAYIDLGGLTGVAKIVTLHLPLDYYEPRLRRGASGVVFTCVSASQRAQVESLIPVHATIENGIDVRRWRPLDGIPGEYVACLGRICPEKGFDIALRAAHAANVPLLLAGEVFPYPDHQQYFADCIEPFLDERRRFIGAVGGAVKRRFLADARCLVVPSRVAETSSLVTMEALASGTPVIVSGVGAPASLIEPGVTGLVAEDEAALCEALGKIGALDRRACRTSARRRFDVRDTTRRYLELYASLAGHRPDVISHLGADTVA
jgi:glycosyltransferase involved in cell wall biosynthesis